MPKNTKSASHWRELFFVGTPVLLLMVVGFVVAYQFVEPAPPGEITVASGPKDGAYFGFAKRYAEALLRQGITLHVRETKGSVENLALLADPESGVDLAFTQSGTGEAEAHPELVSLGSLYYEPLWIFLRQSLPGRFSALRGGRIAVGEEGSGTKAVVERLLAENAIDGTVSTLVAQGGQVAVRQLEAGAVDAACFVSSVDSPLLQELLGKDELSLMELERVSAYTRRHRYLSRVELLAGVVDPGRNIPSADVSLLSPVASLTAREDFHPALVELLLGAANKVHGAPSVFEAFARFPSAEFTDFPVTEEARRFLTRGPSFLNRFLPFWAANFVDRMLVMLIPLVTLLIPLFRVVPPLYRWRVRSRFKRWYRDLQMIDGLIVEGSEAVKLNEALERLEAIQSELAKITVPPSYGDELYQVHAHMAFVRRRVEELNS